MKNLLVWQKLTLLGAVFLLPLLVVTWAMISSVQNLGRAAAKKELLGVEYSRPLLDLLRDLQRRRGLATAVAAGSGALRADFTEAGADLERDLAVLDAVNARLRRKLKLEGQWPTLAADCRALLAAAPADAAATIEAPTAVSRRTLSLLGEIADRSELTLDPDLGSYYFMDLFTRQLPQHAEQVGRAWACIAATPPGDRLPAQSLDELRGIVSLIDFLRDGAKEALSRAMDGAQGSGTQLQLPDATRISDDDPVGQVLATGFLKMDPAAFSQAMTSRLGGDYQFAARVSDELTRLIQNRLDGLSRKIAYSLAQGVAGLLAVSWLGWFLIRDITRPLGSLAATARAIEAHDTDARVTVAPREDEIGTLASALQQMIAAQRHAREKLVESNLALLATNEKLQVKTDEAQRLAVEADAANRAKRDFLAVMSHEIRTPMNGIIGMTELALNTQLTESQREYLDMVKGSAESLLELLNDILDFSKIEAGRLDLEHIDFDLRDTLGDTMQTLGVRASAKGLELALQIRPDVPDALFGDPHRLRQIVVNLVGNALKFTDRGEVTVLVENVGACAGGAVLRFAVRDTGIGIPAAARERIFSAFSQADASTTRRFGGTGLGLAITSQLVGLMSGEIRVASEPGQGSTFIFTARFGLQTPRVEVPVPELENLRVLAVDDNATNRLILRELFTSWRMEVVVADSAEAGLAALEAAGRAGRPIALVVTDMMMPEIDGFGFVERMKENPALRETRVIMLTSSNRPEDVARCAALGVGAHIAKPIKQSTLMDTIVDVLGSGQRRKRHVPGGGAVPLQRPLHILLAEDNAVNQRLAVVNLESWGHHVTVAHDGAEAVEDLDREPFDVILMDSQMPRMDGFEATAAIRQRERGTGRHIPIIAMTANVMRGYREECLAAGMDGYVAKPMRRDELIAALAAVVPNLLLSEKLAPPTPATVVAEKSAALVAQPASSVASEPFDSAALLERLGGDRVMLGQMVRLCVEVDAPRLLAILEDGVKNFDLSAVEQAAHGLKGLVGEFQAPAAFSAAKKLEESACLGRTGAVPVEAAALIEAYARLAAALRVFAGSAPRASAPVLPSAS